jgi:hypothetical protein
MKIPRRERGSPLLPLTVRARQDAGGRVVRVTHRALVGAARLFVIAGGTARATQSGAADTTTALQALPDSTLRGLAATSVGLGAGFFLAGKSRLVVVAGIAPALLAAAAIIARPIQPSVLLVTVPTRSGRRWHIPFTGRRRT